MTKVIEARAVISGEDRLSKVIDGLSKKFKGLSKDLKTGVEIDNLNRSLANTRKQLEAIERVNAAQGRLANSRYGLGALKDQADRAAAALAAARKAGDAGAARDAATQHKAAQRAVDQATSAINRQAAAVRDARRAFNEMGVPVSDLAAHERRLRASLDQTTSAINRQAAAEKKRHEVMERSAARSLARRDALSGATATAGVVAAHRGKTIGLDAITAAGSMDYAVRYQHVATDVSEDTQRTLLIPQAKRIGQETKFSNEDVIEAQTATMQGLPFKDPAIKARVGAAIVEQARNYAVMFRSNMPEAGEGIRSYLQNTNKDISTPEKAIYEANRATNLVIKAAKLGGMNNEDAQQFMKFGLPTATQAGFSDVTSMALGALARRSGLKGDEAGVFIRAAASKLISPTKKGMEAEIVAGIDRSKYQKMPDQLAAEAFGQLGKSRFGVSFNKSQQTRLRGMLQNGELITDREEFIKQVSGVVGESFDKVQKGKNKGQLKAQDASKIAKLANDFHRMSVESTDVEGLLREHMNNPRFTAALRNAFYTDKHGGKAGILATKFDQFAEDRSALEDVTHDPEFGAKRAKYMTEGLGGTLDNLKGGWETMVLNIGQANEGLIRFAADGLSKGTDMFSNLSSTSQQVLSLVGMGGAAAGGVYGTAKFLGAIFGTGGGAAALTASATALDGSGAALTAAAIKLGGGGVVGGAASGAGGALAGGAIGGAATATLVGSGALVGAYLGDAMPKAVGSGATLGDAVNELAAIRKRLDGGAAAAASLGYTAPGRGVMMPGGLNPGAGYASSVEFSRGAVGDFLHGRQKSRIDLPGFGTGDKQMPGGPITAELKSPVPVTVAGELSGQATVTHVVEAKPSQWLVATITAMQQSIVQMQGKIASVAGNGAGSTGKSSPDAAKGGRD